MLGTHPSMRQLRPQPALALQRPHALPKLALQKLGLGWASGSCRLRPSCGARRGRAICQASSDPHQGENKQPEQQPAASPSPQAFGTLLFVTVLWGSYNPVIRMLYEGEHALDPSQLTAIRTVIAASAMMVALVYNKKKQADSGSPPKHDHKPQALPQQAQAKDLPLLARTFDGVVPAGIELGLYNFLGTALQAVGLMLTTATRAGFLVQLTAVLVPVISSVAGVKISNRVWAAASLALVGASLIAFDNPAASVAGSEAGLGSPFAVGDLYLIASCCFYSLATVRLGFYAPKYEAITLASVKKFTLGAASLAWLASTSQGGLTPGVPSITTSMSELPFTDWLLVTYSALGPGALATYLQTRGQAQVPATLAQVVYSLTPLWSAVLAFWILGDEGMGPTAWIGSGAILAASALATTSSGSKSSSTVVSEPAGDAGSASTASERLPDGDKVLAGLPADSGALLTSVQTVTAQAQQDTKVIVTVTVQGKASIEERTRVVVESEQHVRVEAQEAPAVNETERDIESIVIVAEQVEEPAVAEPAPASIEVVAEQVEEPAVAEPAPAADAVVAEQVEEPAVAEPAPASIEVVAEQVEEPAVAEPAPAAVAVVAEQVEEPAVAEPAPAAVAVVAEQVEEPAVAEPAPAAVAVVAEQVEEPAVAEAAPASIEVVAEATAPDTQSADNNTYRSQLDQLAAAVNGASVDLFDNSPKRGKKRNKKRKGSRGALLFGDEDSELGSLAGGFQPRMQLPASVELEASDSDVSTSAESIVMHTKVAEEPLAGDATLIPTAEVDGKAVTPESDAAVVVDGGVEVTTAVDDTLNEHVSPVAEEQVSSEEAAAEAPAAPQPAPEAVGVVTAEALPETSPDSLAAHITTIEAMVETESAPVLGAQLYDDAVAAGVKASGSSSGVEAQLASDAPLSPPNNKKKHKKDKKHKKGKGNQVDLESSPSAELMVQDSAQAALEEQLVETGSLVVPISMGEAAGQVDTAQPDLVTGEAPVEVMATQGTADSLGTASVGGAKEEDDVAATTLSVESQVADVAPAPAPAPAEKPQELRSSWPRVVFESVPAKPAAVPAAVPPPPDVSFPPSSEGAWSILAGLEDEIEDARVVAELNAEAAALEQQLQGVLDIAEAVQARSDKGSTPAGTRQITPGPAAGQPLVMNDIVAAPKRKVPEVIQE